MHDKSEVSVSTVVNTTDLENSSGNILRNISNLGGNKIRKFLNSYSKGFNHTKINSNWICLCKFTHAIITLSMRLLYEKN